MVERERGGAGQITIMRRKPFLQLPETPHNSPCPHSPPRHDPRHENTLTWRKFATIHRGQAVLGDLGAQRDMLKNTQKKMYSVANTLGVSGDTIRMIERRAKQDKWIFWAGVVVFFLFCWLCLHFLR